MGMVLEKKLGILHPGKMGTAVAKTARNSGCQVYWVSEGRGPESRKRAEEAGLHDAGSVAKLCEQAAVIVSVCPPEFAEQVADSVLAAGFSGLYCDANAISPQRVKQMARKMEDAGIAFVDGGIIGTPPTERNQTWLNLSGARAGELAELFAAGPLETEIVGSQVGQASALKMCYGGWTKATRALAITILAAANEMGVLEDLKRHWARSGPSYETVERQLQVAVPKAWRFGAEMREIAATMEAAGLPGEFHQGAQELWDRLAGFKNAEEVDVGDVLAEAVKEKETGVRR